VEGEEVHQFMDVVHLELILVLRDLEESLK
jgi:hypothetical protein